MANPFDQDEDDDDYFAEVDEGDDTGKEPRFIRLEELSIQPTVLADMKVDELFTTFIGLRNQLTTDRKGWKSREAKVKAQMQTISSVLLNKSIGLGVTALSGATGSGYQQTKERLKIAPDGWEDFCDWLYETRNFQVVQKRVSPDAVKDIRAETGSLPPGIESTSEMTFVVRSPTARKIKT
jgi:hypothetical protein